MPGFFFKAGFRQKDSRTFIDNVHTTYYNQHKECDQNVSDNGKHPNG